MTLARTLLGVLLCASASSAQEHRSFTADYRETTNMHLINPRIMPAPKVLEGRYVRDRQGRMRQEDWFVDEKGERSERRIVIADPVAGVKVQLFPSEKRALRTPLLTRRPGSSVPPQPPPSLGQAINLGVQTIEGFSCEGTKRCNANGSCNETWWCPSIGYVVRMLLVKPDGLFVDSRWYNFKTDITPDPVLFAVPSDYEVVNQPPVPAADLSVTRE